MTDISKRNKAAKRRGAQWETDLLNYFRQRGLLAERLPKTGVKDEGDLWVHGGTMPRYCVVEAKNAARITLAEWVEEARVEAQHFSAARGLAFANPIVVIKRRNHGVEKAYVVQELDDWLLFNGILE